MLLISRINCVTISLFTLVSQLIWAETIVIKGSDTLGAKLVPQLAEGFRADNTRRNHDVSFEVIAEGSATGIAAILDSSADIGMLSRNLDEQDRTTASEKGIQPNTIQIARDRLVVIVNENNPIDRLTSAQVRAIFSGDVKNWAALSLFPGDISVYTRGTASGSYGAFQTLALRSRNYGEFSQKLAGNEQIATEVAENPFAIGYVGLAYAGREGVKTLEIDGHMPVDADYPYARPLFFLVNSEQELSPKVSEFIEFVLSEKGQSIIERASFLPHEERLKRTPITTSDSIK